MGIASDMGTCSINTAIHSGYYLSCGHPLPCPEHKDPRIQSLFIDADSLDKAEAALSAAGIDYVVHPEVVEGTLEEVLDIVEEDATD